MRTVHERVDYYGSAQAGHLYFLTATAHTPHIDSDIVQNKRVREVPQGRRRERIKGAYEE